MVSGKSPEWLPSGFTEKVKYKNGRRIKYYYNVSTGATFYSKKRVLSSVTAENSLHAMARRSNGDDNGLQSESKVDAELDKPDDSTKWLPDGWTSEERTRRRGAHRGSIYKVYTDVSSGKRFYSRVAVTKYLNTIDRANTCDNTVEPLPHMSPHSLSMKSTDTIPEEKKKGNSFRTFDKADEPSSNCLSMINTVGIPEEKHDDSFKTLANVDDPSTNASPQCQTMTKTCSIPGNKKNSSFKPVTVQSSSADDLPPGWIKEVITSKSGKKTRKDPYYTDPVSGYVFCSKLDALRFIKTNDIGACAIRPKKRELDDLNLVKNAYPSAIPVHEISPEHREQLVVLGESNGCLQNSGTNSPSISESQFLKQTISHNNHTDVLKVTFEETISCQNPLKNTEPQNIPEPDYAVSKEEPTETAQAKSRNSRKRKVPNLPPRVSKRLSGSNPEMAFDSFLNERLLRAAAKISTSTEEANASQPPENKPAKEIEPPKEIEMEPPPIEVKSPQPAKETEPPKEIEMEPPPIEVKNPPNENSVADLQEEPNKQESPFLFDFGDSWSDPLEFALKTLRGDIPLDSLTAFPGYFNENLSIPSNNNRIDDCFRPSSESDVPKIFQNKVAGTSKQQGAVHPLPDNSLSFSGLGDIGLPDFGGFNGPPSSDIRKKDNQTKFN